MLSVSLSADVLPRLCCARRRSPAFGPSPFRSARLCCDTHKKAVTGRDGLASPHNHQLRLLRRDQTVIQESTEGNNGTQEEGTEQCREDRTQQGDEEGTPFTVWLSVDCGQSSAATSGRRDRVSGHFRHGLVQRIRPVQASRKPVTLAAVLLPASRCKLTMLHGNKVCNLS